MQPYNACYCFDVQHLLYKDVVYNMVSHAMELTNSFKLINMTPPNLTCMERKYLVYI